MQSYVLMPTLLNIYSEDVFDESITNIEVGNWIRYTDYIVLLATNLEDLVITAPSKNY